MATNIFKVMFFVYFKYNLLTFSITNRVIYLCYVVYNKSVLTQTMFQILTHIKSTSARISRPSHNAFLPFHFSVCWGFITWLTAWGTKVLSACCHPPVTKGHKWLIICQLYSFFMVEQHVLNTFELQQSRYSATTDMQQRYQASYTAPSYGVVSHGAQFGGLWVFADHTRKQTQNKCAHDLRVLRRL